MSNLVVGVDLGGTNIKAALCSEVGEVLAEDRTPTLAEEGPAAVCDRMAALVRSLMDQAPGGPDSVAAIGVGAPGPLDSSAGIVFRCPNLPGWDNYPVVSELSSGLGGKSVYLENDANAAALAEAWVGAGKGLRHLVCLTLGTGVGGGVVVDGKLLKGRGLAAELGHIIIEEGGRPCTCGSAGCLEAYASASAVVKRAVEQIKKAGSRTRLPADGLTCKDVFDAAAASDELALDVVTSTARYLAAGIGSLVNIFHPDCVVLTGGMILAGKKGLLRPTRRFLSERAFPEFLKGLQISLSPLHDRAGVLGAAAVALSRRGVPVVR